MTAQRNSVAGIALDGERIFIARRKAGGDLGSKWEFPGGKVKQNESAEAALIREYREELELEVAVGGHIASSSFEHNGTAFTLDAYRIFFESPENIKLAEHSEWKWVPLGEIHALDFADSDRGLFAALEAYIKRQLHIE
jgi:8-oxo-dGTP diphosphatase